MNRLLLVCLSAIVWCMVSCTDKDKIPKGVLGKEKMQKVLMDMIEAERFRDGFIVYDSSKDQKTETFKLYAQVFELNKISKDEFIKSYKFYMSRPDIAREIFDSLSSQAAKLRENLNKPVPLDTAAKSKAFTDSVKAKTADSAKVKAADSAKKITPPPPAAAHITPPPGALQPAGSVSPENLAKRRAAFRRFKFRDTLLKLNTKPRP
ncbi:MAG: DUF4296 domain-containing protein [Niastella sp.]|jgi:hypothetical protein|uniref:DUF4296 domain-containing protein n=1 Tax=Niastella sp. TaxID=1869183 RepID=UPI003899929D